MATAGALPRHVRVAIVGGGVIGCSVAYHLGKAGWRDVLLLEQAQLTAGTTWHAAGLVGQLRPNRNHSELAAYSARLYETLAEEIGQATGWTRCGSLLLATTPGRLTAIRRAADVADNFGIDCELVDGAEAGRRWPPMRSDDVLGALWLPGDGKANPADLAQAFAKGARAYGVDVREGVRVLDVRTRNERVAGLETSAGPIKAELVVDCAGQWARQVGAMAGVDVPLHSAEHFYLVTEPIEGVHPELPVMRDPDGYIYFKEEVGGLAMGGFEPKAKPWAGDGVPWDFAFRLLPEDWEQVDTLVRNALHRVPAMRSAGIKQAINGLESFTPDGHFIAGEAPWLEGFYVCAGFNSSGIASAGGAGRLMAEWLEAGEAPMDVADVDIRRFAGFHNTPAFLRARTVETLGLHYALRWPRLEMESARPLRCSPLYERQRAEGAAFGSKMGWERPLWFAPQGPAEPRYSFERPGWVAPCLAEQRAAREAVAIFDQSSLAKLAVEGPEAEAVLQRLCANDVAVEPGRVVYTGMLNARGGFESDVTVTRLAAERFLVVTGAGQATRDHARLHRAAVGLRARISDVTSAHAVIGVMGPRARDLLGELSPDDLSDEAFPFAAARRIAVGAAPVLALRVSYVGGLGWELYVPGEFAGGLYDALKATGAAHGLADGGTYAIDALRIEKGYRAWGHELTADDTPVHAGLTFAVKPDKGVDFVGRAAVLRQMEAGVARRLVHFVVREPEAMLWGGEPILRDGARVGEITSAGLAYASEAIVAMGYVDSPEPLSGRAAWADYVAAGTFEVLLAGTRLPAEASLSPAL